MKMIWVNQLELHQLRLKAKLHQVQAAQLVGVSLRTYKKYETNGKIPKCVYEMLVARAGAIWDGWSWWDGYLYDDVGRQWHQGSLLAAYYTLKAAEASNVEFHRKMSGTALHSHKGVNRAKPINVSLHRRRKAANDSSIEDRNVE